MAKRPSFQAYPGDWLRDAVSGCSLAAQGLWLRMMFIAHDSERYGYLQQNGKPIPHDSIARRSGAHSVEQYLALLLELDDAGVPSRTPDGVIYSRRMVRDEHERTVTKLAMRQRRAGGYKNTWEQAREDVLNRDKRMCAYCGKTAKTVDHVTPMSKGGSNLPHNLVACCGFCNSRKKDRTLEEAAMSFHASFDVRVLLKKQEEEDEEEEIKEVKVRSKSKACRIPEDFTPKDEHYALAKELGVNCEMEFQKFRDYYLGVAGQQSVKRDWDSTLRNWLRNSITYSRGHYGTNRADGPSKTEKRVRKNREAILSGLGIGHEPGYGEPDLQDRDDAAGNPGMATVLERPAGKDGR